MTNDAKPPRRTLKRVRTLLWILVGVAAVGAVALLLIPRATTDTVQATTASAQAGFGGPFTLVGGNGKPFSSQALAGKPYAIFFGFTRCGDVCPVTLGRLVKLRNQSGGEQAFNIVFVTIDPKNDGPKEVGQYATLFGSPIIGLTGTPAQIDQVKKQYGIFAQPSAHATPGKEMEHSAMVLLFDRGGNLAGTIAAEEADSAALAKLKTIV